MNYAHYIAIKHTCSNLNLGDVLINKLLIG